MPGHRDQLIDELSERMQAFAKSGDSTGVLDAAVPGLARDHAETLWSTSYVDITPDVARALTALVTVHWIRSQLLPDGQDHDDLLACRKWSGPLLAVAPDLVPEPVRAYLGRP
jgi:hypothetical protein